MTAIEIQSIPDSLRKGTLIELSSDYRTAGAIRAHLPEPVKCAMSSAAFRAHILKGSTEEKRLRVEAICVVLGHALHSDGEPTWRWIEHRFTGEDGREQGSPLKLEWFSPNRYWVVLLPEESLRAVSIPAKPNSFMEAHWGKHPIASAPIPVPV
jgi:hypothetical protein